MTTSFSFGTSKPPALTLTGGTSGSFFGAPASVTSAPLSFFGNKAVNTSGGTTASTSTALTTSIGNNLFAQATPAVITASTSGLTGLGGSGNFPINGAAGAGTVSGNSVGVTGLAASGNPMEGEVPKQIADSVAQLKEHLKGNKEKADEFVTDSNEACLDFDERLNTLKKLKVQCSSNLRNESQKVNVLLKKSERDVYAAEQLARRQKEAGKNPHYGQNLAIEYLEATCAEYEMSLSDIGEILQRLEDAIAQRLGDQNKPSRSKEDFMKLLQQFDATFKAVVSEVYKSNQQIQDLKEAFLEKRRAALPYAPNPFAKKVEEERMKLARFSGNGFGAEAFPSQVTMMKIGELARIAAPANNPIGNASTFGTTGSLFGSKPLGTMPFSFSTTSTSNSLFKPNTSSTSTAPLFGGTKTTTSAASTAAPAFTFGNTLNSTASGTLFGGSASKPFGK